MRIAILHNPRAGRGRGAAIAESFAAEVRQAGHEVRSIDVTRPSTHAQLPDLPADSVDALIEWSEGVVIVGGDGTLHHSLPVLLRHRRPIYHAAMGTENLFARGFGHRRSPEGFLKALRTRSIRTIDVATLSQGEPGAGSTPFVIMASIGPDASIVHRLSALRSGPISHLSYVGPSLAELFSPRIPLITARVDGRPLVHQKHGMLLIANMRQYAVGLNPAGNADPGDGLLDVVFLPGRSILAVAMSLVLKRLGVPAGWRVARGRSVELKVEGPTNFPMQADGEAISNPLSGRPEGGSIGNLTAQIIPNAIDTFAI